MTLSFQNLLGGLRTQEMLFYLKTNQGKLCMNKVQETPGMSFQVSSLSGALSGPPNDV